MLDAEEMSAGNNYGKAKRQEQNDQDAFEKEVNARLKEFQKKRGLQELEYEE